MAWSVPCPECGTQNEPDGSGAVLCASCGRFYKVPVPGITSSLGIGIGDTTLPGSAPRPVMRAATYGGMGEIEAHLTEMGIPYRRVSDTSIQVVRQIGPQTVDVTIDSARTIHIASSTGVKDLTLGDSASTQLYFDPEWKERYDFDLALEDKTFALMNASGDGLADIPDDLPTPPLPGPRTPAGGTEAAVTQPSLPPVQVAGYVELTDAPLPAPPSPAATLGVVRTPSTPTIPSQTPAALAASMRDALRSAPDPEEETAKQSLAEISAMIPKRVDIPSVITDLIEGPTQNEPHPLAPHALREDDAPFPIPAVILPSTPDGRPPVLAPTPVPPPRRTTPSPPPLEEPRRPSGSIHIANGASRDVIDVPISARVEPEPDPEPPPSPVAEAHEEEERVATTPSRPAFQQPVDDGEVITKPSVAPFRPSGERRQPAGAEPVPFRPSGERRLPPPPVLHRFDEPAPADDTTRVPTAPRAMAARARRSGTVWAGLLGLAVGAAVGLQAAIPARLEALLPPTAPLEVRAGAQAARQGDVDGALAHFRRAAELDPRSAPAWRNLGVAYALKGDQVRSAEAYRKYLELEQDGDQARKVRSLLEEK